MLNNPQIKRMLAKLRQLEDTLEPYVFQKVDTLDVLRHETTEHLYAPPADPALYSPIAVGDKWGNEHGNCWFKGSYTVPAALAGQPLYVYPHIGGYEILMYVNGMPFGEFAYKITPTGHGNHYCDMFKLEPEVGEVINLDFEAYAGHYVIGCYPFETNPCHNFTYDFEGFDICTKNQDIADFIFDLRTLNRLVAAMDESSFRRGDVINCLTEVHNVVYYSPDHADMDTWRAALKEAREIMRPCLEAKNADSAAFVGLVGHSHMDTAWLWDIPETIRKCARTFANQLSLMEQYPEYRFVQSSAYHLEMIRRHYPELFEKLREAIKSGRYEPNGAVYVECDCNITGGESMVRQFLWGQRYTREHFNYTSDCFWLPDTFGYSAAIPQIMKGSGVDYFLTTKLSWNDTTRFPYESFKWEGIDGTNVFVHFNTTHNWPEPDTLINRTEGRGQVNDLQQKTVAKQRLVSYGFGDGGGGPQFEMIELARRCRDLDGCPKSEHISVSDFMKGLEKSAIRPNTYAGELYLELHRGTLTNQHQIKYNNRKAEIAIHGLELVTVADAVNNSKAAEDKAIRPLVETMLVNQFHDILPGTCIQAAHEQSHEQMSKVIADAKAQTAAIVAGSSTNTLSIINTLPFDVNDVFYLNNTACVETDNIAVKQQLIENIAGENQLAVTGMTLPAMSAVTIHTKDSCTCGMEKAASPFIYSGDKLTTPFAEVVFNEKGYIKSFIDRSNGRELVGDGYAFNTLLMAEDVPSEWDNWDIDADCQMRFKDSAALIKEEAVQSGAAQLRIRRLYKLSDKSTLHQDMIFHSHTPRVDFETQIDWHDKRRFLKAAFDTTILARQARHEIQFGYVCKPTTRNTTTEQSMFEVVNHKYTDLSEPGYGCAILNDCKYGISVEGGNMRLSLHKGGIRPDPRGDAGLHSVTYSFLPHNCGFSADSVIKPAYALNYQPIVANGSFTMPKLISVDAPNVIVEAIKPCEDNERAFIARIYEAEGTYTNATVAVSGKAYECNLLEEVQHELTGDKLAFKPFEIKTIKVCY